MPLSTEYIEIPKGPAWTPVLNTTLAFAVQNTANVLLEYSFTEGVTRGSFLTPYTVVADIQQPIYIRFVDADQNGSISITRVTNG